VCVALRVEDGDNATEAIAGEGGKVGGGGGVARLGSGIRADKTRKTSGTVDYG